MYLMKAITDDHRITPIYMYHEVISKFEVGNYYKLIAHTTFKLPSGQTAIRVNAKTRVSIEARY